MRENIKTRFFFKPLLTKSTKKLNKIMFSLHKTRLINQRDAKIETDLKISRFLESFLLFLVRETSRNRTWIEFLNKQRNTQFMNIKWTKLDKA
jgi:hypothetical protein